MNSNETQKLAKEVNQIMQKVVPVFANAVAEISVLAENAENLRQQAARTSFGHNGAA